MNDEQFIEKFWSRVDKNGANGCWLWLASIGSHGYGQFTRDYAVCTAHRFSYELVNGRVLNGLHVLHKCDVRACVNPDHLFLGTSSDNSKDMWNKGRHPIKRDIKLTFKDVCDIRASKKMVVELAAIYGVTPEHVSRVKNFHLRVAE